MIPRRFASTTRALTPLQRKKKAAELTKTSLSEIFEFVGGSADDAVYKEHVDIPKVIEDPQSFAKLSFNQRESIIDHMDGLKHSDWTKMERNEKQLLYFISYGNWGPRKSFKNPISNDYIPEDLPFQHRSKSVSTNALVTKLPPVNLLSVTKERSEEFEKSVKRLDPFSQTIVLLGFLVTGLAVYKDVSGSSSQVNSNNK